MKLHIALFTLVALGCSKPSTKSIDSAELGPSPVVSNAPPMPTGGVHPAPWPEPPASKLLEACTVQDCVRIPGRNTPAAGEARLDAQLGTVVGIDPVDALRYRAQIRVTGNQAATGRFESIVVAEPGEVIPTAAGMARVLDVRVVSPKTTWDPRWYSYAVLEPIDPDWKRPAQTHVFVTYRGTTLLGNHTLHLDEIRKSLVGDAATLTARGALELHFNVQADTVFDLDGVRFRVVTVQPAVAKNIGWVEIDAAPGR